MIDDVDAARLRDLTFELVEVVSPTGDTARVAHLYARRLEEIGMDVELHDEVFPATPIVVGTLRGGLPGPRIVLNGHLDTVPIPHAPPRIEDGAIFGRGSADMKGAVACAAEVARVLAARGSFPGELMVVAIGLHESPGGRGEDLTWLLDEHGFTADLAIVCELGGHVLPVAHMGAATFEIAITREGIPTHELQTPAGTPHPLLAAGRVITALEAWSAELAHDAREWVGAPTVFLGEVHGGDFYNRFANRCVLVGTRRWPPGEDRHDVERDFRARLAALAADTGCTIDLDFRLVRDSYEIDPEHPLAQALAGAYADVTGKTLEPIGMKVVADGALFAQAGIPTVYHGPAGTGAHADEEWIEVAELVRATQVYLRTLERIWD
jgi:acetylornithine deacetylase